MASHSHTSYDNATRTIAELRKIIGGRGKFKPVGGYRRGKESMKDIDVITNITLDKVATKLTEQKITSDTDMETITSDRRKLTIYYGDDKVQIDLFYVKDNEWVYALLHYTGDKNFNIHMRHHANQLGYKLNQYGLYHVKDNKRVRGSLKVTKEQDIFKLIDFKYHKPEDRVGDKIKISS